MGVWGGKEKTPGEKGQTVVRFRLRLISDWSGLFSAQKHIVIPAMTTPPPQKKTNSSRKNALLIRMATWDMGRVRLGKQVGRAVFGKFWSVGFDFKSIHV